MPKTSSPEQQIIARVEGSHLAINERPVVTVTINGEKVTALYPGFVKKMMGPKVHLYGGNPDIDIDQICAGATVALKKAPSRWAEQGVSAQYRVVIPDRMVTTGK